MFASALCYALLVTAAAPAPDKNDPAAMTEWLRQGYIDNRAKFDQLDCEFTVEGGKAASREEAIAGRFESKTSHTGKLVVDGKSMRYDLICEKTEPVKLTEEQRRELGHSQFIGAGCRSERLLFNGEIVGRLSTLNFAIQRAKNTDYSVRYLPIDLDATRQMTPALKSYVKSKYEEIPLRYVGRQRVDGKEYEAVEFRHEAFLGYGAWSTRWVLDPEHGFLPIAQIMSEQSELKQEKTVLQPHLENWYLDIRKMDNGGFIPFKCVQLWFNSKPMHASVLKVTKLEVGKPAPESLELEIPAETHVYELTQSRGGRGFQLDEAKRIGVQDLGAWLARVSKPK